MQWSQLFGDRGPGCLTTEARRVADLLPNGQPRRRWRHLHLARATGGADRSCTDLSGWPGFSKDLPRGSGLLAGTSATLAVGIGLLPAGRSWHCLGFSFFAALAGKIGDKEWAEAVIARYPKGQSIAASYSPTNPAIAVLEATTRFGVQCLPIELPRLRSDLSGRNACRAYCAQIRPSKSQSGTSTSRHRGWLAKH
jgi:hypothetical protein